MKKLTAAVLAGTIALPVALAAWLYLTSPSYRLARLDSQIAALEHQLRADAAALVVERAECATTGARYGPELARTCWDGLALQTRLVAETAQAARRRLAELRAQRDAIR